MTTLAKSELLIDKVPVRLETIEGAEGSGDDFDVLFGEIEGDGGGFGRHDEDRGKVEACIKRMA